MKHVSGSFLVSATDLSNHLGCQHLTQLNRLVALKEIKEPNWNDPALTILAKRGEEHETAYVSHLAKKGLTTINLKGKALETTIDAMKKGIDVLVQARLANGSWLGYADILIKVKGESCFGNWSYEVQDTKLAQNTRAATILQLCVFSDLLSVIQQSSPEKMCVVKPGEDFVIEAYRYSDFQAYYRLVKKNFEYIISQPQQATYPEPVDHCSICRCVTKILR